MAYREPDYGHVTSLNEQMRVDGDFFVLSLTKARQDMPAVWDTWGGSRRKGAARTLFPSAPSAAPGAQAGFCSRAASLITPFLFQFLYQC